MDPAEQRAELDRLVREHLRDFYALALRLTGRPDPAEELVQETLVRVARGWEEFRGEAQFRTWVYRILINAFRSRPARPVQAKPAALERLETRAPGPDQEALAAELAERVAQAVAHLPPRQREVFVLHTYEGFGYAEIAELAGISLANVRSQLHLARQRLREQLKPLLEASE